MRADIVLGSDPATAEALESALAPETESPVPGTSVRADAQGDGLHLEIEADDVSALRAALNSYLRFASTAEQVQDRRE